MNRWILIILLCFSCGALFAGVKKTQNQKETRALTPILQLAGPVKKTKNQRETKKSKLAGNAVEEFENTRIPSLSDTISRSNRMKSRIKKQLAKELDGTPDESVVQRSSAGAPAEALDPEDTLARFGDFEVSISARGEEELTADKKERTRPRVRTKKKSHRKSAN